MEYGLAAEFYFLLVLFWAFYAYSETENHHKYQEGPWAKIVLGSFAHIQKSRPA